MPESYKDTTITNGSIANNITDIPDFLEPAHISLHNQTTDTAISSSAYTITEGSRNTYGAYDGASISLNASTVSNNDVVRVTRDSSNLVNSVHYPITDFTNGSKLTAEALDKNSVQCIFVAQEAKENLSADLSLSDLTSTSNTYVQDDLEAGHHVLNVQSPTKLPDSIYVFVNGEKLISNNTTLSSNASSSEYGVYVNFSDAGSTAANGKIYIVSNVGGSDVIEIIK